MADVGGLLLPCRGSDLWRGWGSALSLFMDKRWQATADQTSLSQSPFATAKSHAICTCVEETIRLDEKKRNKPTARTRHRPDRTWNQSLSLRKHQKMGHRPISQRPPSSRRRASMNQQPSNLMTMYREVMFMWGSFEEFWRRYSGI